MSMHKGGMAMAKKIKINYLDMMDIELNLNTRRTILSGNSGTGKTYLYSLLEGYNEVENEDRIKCIDIDNVDRDNPQFIVNMLEQLEDYIIVIDQADDVLNYDVIREFVMADRRNYYILIGRKCSTYVRELAEPEITDKTAKIKYLIDTEY